MQRNHHRHERNDRDVRHLGGHHDRGGDHGNQFAGGRRGGSMNMDNDRMSDSYSQMNRGYDEYDRSDYGYDSSHDLRDSQHASRHFEANDNYGQGRSFHDDRPVVGDRYGYDRDDRYGRSGHAQQRFDHDRDDSRWGRDHANAPGSYATYEDQRRMTARDGGSRYQSSSRNQPSYDQVYNQAPQRGGGQYYGARDYRSSRTIGEPRYGGSRDSVPHDYNMTNDYSYGRNHSYGMEDVRSMQGSDEWRGGYRHEEDHTDAPRGNQNDRRWLANGYEADNRGRRGR